MPPQNSRARADRDLGPDRLDRALPQAIRENDLDRVRQLIQDAHDADQLDNKILASALCIACEQGRLDVVRFLLRRGVPADARLRGKTALMLARSREMAELLLDNQAHLAAADGDGRTALMQARDVEVAKVLLEKAAAIGQRDALIDQRDSEGRNALINMLMFDRQTALEACSKIAEILIDNGANIEAADPQGRTVLITAVCRNRVSILRRLIKKGVSVNRTDAEGKNALHHMCEDRERAKRAQTNRATVEDETVLRIILDTNVDVNAKDDIAERTPLHWAVASNYQVLIEALLANGKADINAVEHRRKTPLHIAIASKRITLAEILLLHGANVNAESDGCWTPLHTAAEHSKDSVGLVRLLLAKGADANRSTTGGKTALHVASEAGNIEVVKYLLGQPGVKAMVRDIQGNTPLLCAAKLGHKHIVEHLAPLSQVISLSENAIEASKGFLATIIDFTPHKEKGNRRVWKPVYNLLYEKYQLSPENPVRDKFDADDPTKAFRWIHLPANNIAWCQETLLKRFVEQDGADAESFKLLERSFNHQHRGKQIHAHFMRPVCQLVPGVPLRANAEDGKTHPLANGNNPPGKSGQQASSMHDSRLFSSDKLYMFMPYLHFETNSARREMQTAVKRARLSKAEVSHKDRSHLDPSAASLRSKSYASNRLRYAQHRTNADESLIRAHVNSSSCSLNIRRTLDQFFYRTIDTRFRDDDQVVQKYQLKHSEPEDVKVLMVDQLWMWVLGRDLIVTSFPQRWKQPRDDPHDVLENIVNDINLPTRAHVSNIHELAMIIAGHCLGSFDRRNIVASGDTLFLDMFESSIGDAMDEETRLFEAFQDASEKASNWLNSTRGTMKLTAVQKRSISSSHAQPQDVQDFEYSAKSYSDPTFVQTLLDIGAETRLLRDVKDIRDELDMLKMIFTQQEELLPEMLQNILRILEQGAETGLQQSKISKIYEDLSRHISNPLKDIERMDEQAKRIYNSIRNLLDLKQKHANAMQAADTARQGQTLRVFTIVTVIFLPLSFLAAFFAIDIADFPHNQSGNQELPLGFVSKYVFGVGAVVAIFCVILALTVEKLTAFARDSGRGIRQRIAASREDRKQRTPMNRNMNVSARNDTFYSITSPRPSSDGMKGMRSRVSLPPPDVESGITHR